MPVEFDSRPFWRPRDLAAMLGVGPSQIYRLVESGELDHVKVGQRAVRVPAASVARYLGITPSFSGAPGSGQPDLDGRARRFEQRTGLSPASFVAAWRRDEIADTAEHNEDAMEALALRDASSTVR